jgi:pimeloyl-ACP methyl ester carboxylesterase
MADTEDKPFLDVLLTYGWDWVRLTPRLLSGSVDSELQQTMAALRTPRQEMAEVANRRLNRALAAAAAGLARAAYLANPSDLMSFEQELTSIRRGEIPAWESMHLVENPPQACDWETGGKPRGYFVRSGETLFVVIRGSQGAFDWLAINSQLLNVASMGAHLGYTALAAWVAREVLAGGHHSDPRHRRIVTVGHSLGGAVARIIAWIIRRLTPKDVIVECITFGAPAVARSSKAHPFAATLPEYHFANAGDLIAGFGPGDEFPDFLISADGCVYQLDGTVTGRLLRLLELVRVMREHPRAPTPFLQILLIKIREAFEKGLSEWEIDNDILLSMDRKNFGALVMAEHAIEKYESRLQLGLQSSN